MPSAKRVRWAQLRVGVMALVAMLILGVLVWLLTKQKPLFTSDSPLYTYLRDSAAMSTGAPVRLNGIPIGSVTGVDLSGLRDPAKVVRITMKVQTRMLSQIPVDSIAGVSAENVLGTKYINITKGQAAQTIQPGGTLQAEPSTEIEDLVKKGFGLFDSAQAILGRIDKLVGQIESGQGSVGKFLVDEEFYNRLVATVAEFQKVTQAISSGKGTVGKLLYDEALYDEARQTVSRLDAMLDDLQRGQGPAGKLLKDPALYDETRASITSFRKLLDDINAGKGTAGKLLKDEAAYQQIQAILNKIDNSVDRLNQGQGTLGQLMVNPQLYESMRGLTDELHGLTKDIRANPKKFLQIRLHIF